MYTSSFIVWRIKNLELGYPDKHDKHEEYMVCKHQVSSTEALISRDYLRRQRISSLRIPLSTKRLPPACRPINVRLSGHQFLNRPYAESAEANKPALWHALVCFFVRQLLFTIKTVVLLLLRYFTMTSIIIRPYKFLERQQNPGKTIFKYCALW